MRHLKRVPAIGTGSLQRGCFGPERPDDSHSGVHDERATARESPSAEGCRRKAELVDVHFNNGTEATRPAVVVVLLRGSRVVYQHVGSQKAKVAQDVD